MLNEKQIAYLSSLCGDKVIRIGPTVVGFIPQPDECITIPYKKFKEEMGLEDIRFNWMINDNNYIAGGAVLGWILGENNNRDTDFYFKNDKAIEGFELFLTGICGFKKTDYSQYAYSYYNAESNATIQIIDGQLPIPTLDADEDFKVGELSHEVWSLSGDPFDVMSKFDFGLCRFAVDQDNIYTSRLSIRDLLSKSIRLYRVWNEEWTTQRVAKYCRKGFYPNKRMFKIIGEKEYDRLLSSPWREISHKDAF